MSAREYLETLVRLDAEYLEVHQHKDACDECRHTAAHKDVAERMLRDDDFPADDLAKTVAIHWDNYLHILKNEPKLN